MYRRMVVGFIITAFVLSTAACGSTGSNSTAQTSTEPKATTVATTVPTSDTKKEAEPEKGQVVQKEIPAPSLGNNIIGEPTAQKISIYLPKSYNAGKGDYPVVYFLPGFNGPDDSACEFMAAQMNKLVNEGKVKEMILVAVNGRSRLYGSFYINSTVTGNWEDYVVKDVVTYMDTNYRTIKNANARAVTGHSMGGFGAISIGMHHPDVFSVVYGMSPGVLDSSGIKSTDLNPAIPEDKSFQNLSKEEAVKKYLALVDTLQWPTNFTYAYGAAFSPDPSKAPFMKTTTGQGAHDKAVIAEWDSGYGGMDKKVKQYKDNLAKLKAFGIEYGETDEFAWIPQGCKFLSDLLKKDNINCSMVSFDGGHEDKLMERIGQGLLPFTSKNLSFE